MVDACIPQEELCNGMDDDCDNKIDEDFPMAHMTCEVGMGACHASGHVQCTPDGHAAMCDVVAGTPTTETCNNIDDDCDGSTDEGFSLGTACDGPDADQCAEGFIMCAANGTAVCSDNTTDSVERCNNSDDDCDGHTDEDWPVGQACSVGLGACTRSGAMMCNSLQTGVVCSASPGQPTPELCGNGVDEDCNGADAACPSNDLPAGAIDISAGGTWNVDLSAAHDDNWAPTSTGFDCGDMGGRDVFYQFTLPAEEVVYYDSYSSNFDSVIRIFAGACTSLGANLACADDACGTTRSEDAIDLAAGTYCLVLDQFSSSVTTGAGSLKFLRGGRPGVALPNTVGSVTGTTAGKTDLSVASCEANSHRPDVGHFWESCPGTNTISADTCSTSWDTVIYLRSGNAATTGDVSCSDDVAGCGPNGWASSISGATVSGANLQWIIVDGFGTSGQGAYTLSYSIQ